MHGALCAGSWGPPVDGKSGTAYEAWENAMESSMHKSTSTPPPPTPEPALPPPLGPSPHPPGSHLPPPPPPLDGPAVSAEGEPLVERPRPVERPKVSEEKWGRPTISLGFVVVPALLARLQRKLDLDPIDFNVLLHLIDHWWEPAGKIFPSKKRIADRMDVSPSTVQRHIAKLERQGLIRREERYGADRQQLSNVYVIDGLVERLNALALEEIKIKEARRKEDEKRGGRMRHTTTRTQE